MRHYWNRPIARKVEEARHRAFALARSSWTLATLTRRALLNRKRNPTRDHAV